MLYTMIMVSSIYTLPSVFAPPLPSGPITFLTFNTKRRFLKANNEIKYNTVKQNLTTELNQTEGKDPREGTRNKAPFILTLTRTPMKKPN